YGLAFPRYDTTGWLTNLIETLKSEPAVFMPEIMGAFIMILFMVELLRSRSLLSFLRNGMVQNYTASCG
ncbi:hypothetical protein M1O17_05635, partial [Dehalococcoidia bacterium]|nr:hypothetical protein [Dehalococcoidia bacterium]